MKTSNLNVHKIFNFKSCKAGIYRSIKQKGFTAIELLFALGIIAVVTVVVVKMMSGNTDKANTQQMITDISAIANNAKNTYASSNDGYAGLDTATAINANIFPSDLKIDSANSKVNSQFSGGTVEVAVGTDNGQFTITYSNVPSSVCNQVIAQLKGTPPLIGISVNGTAVESSDVAGIGTACSAGSATIEFIAN